MPSMEAPPLLDSVQGKFTPKAAPWASAIPSSREGASSRYLPQTIAHRGYKAVYPENSMAAFRGAVEVGAHAIETDVHLSADGVVVLSHDPSLKRCFGVDRRISECTWDYLSALRTVRQPAQTLPRLSEFLEWLASGPETEKIWVLIDIKMADDPIELIGALGRTLAQVPSATPWNQRIILGCWNATFTQTALSLLPSYPISHISFSTPYSRHFLPIPNMGFNMFQQILVGPLGSWFLQDAKKGGNPVFAWTVNQEKWMEWCIRKNNPSFSSSSVAAETKPAVFIDGVITDDPRLFLQVCSRFEDQLDAKPTPASIAIAYKKRATFVGSITDGLATAWQLLGSIAYRRGLYLLRRLQGEYDYIRDPKFLEQFSSVK
ncbi:Phosphatidylglycerol phospholipase C [Cladobotryum mycophilum]|uniref:Phosphatidylglycerol phospholipase C n=1 Tax=Cladobotryum mycophilum TaxID=491253 RepID=A0ABR0S5V4_9HYPO